MDYQTGTGRFISVADGPIISIVRDGETIHQSICLRHLPRVGERLALAKWDTVYIVTDVFHVYGESMDSHSVQVSVKIPTPIDSREAEKMVDPKINKNGGIKYPKIATICIVLLPLLVAISIGRWIFGVGDIPSFVISIILTAIFFFRFIGEIIQYRKETIKNG